MFALLLSTVVAAATSAVAVPPAPPPAAAKTDRMICETIEELGSRLNRHRECMLQSQRLEQRLQNQRQIDAAQTRQDMPAGK